jgi:ATP-binding cassette subfamily F protein 3
LLLLDEPTNHLDLASREVLEDALDEYDGTLVFISHDRYFINRVATAICEVGGGGAVLYPGAYDTFLEHQALVPPASVDRRAADGASAPDATRDARRDAKRAEAEDRNRRYRERKAFEDRIGPLEAETEGLQSLTSRTPRRVGRVSRCLFC